eukprot:Hpha_TRINITY_DN4595_c0_g1::TRINITY_DN4595_c0_g1_i1::g.115411::m.115411
MAAPAAPAPDEVGAGSVAVNTAVFYPDSSCGWAAGVVIGYHSDGSAIVRDPQRGLELLVSKEAVMLEVPQAFSLLPAESFTGLRSLCDFPPLPPSTLEPAIL